MQKIIIFTFMLLLASCQVFTPRQFDIQQGNIITDEMVSQIKIGMSKERVQNIMGTPVLDNLFDKNRWDYVYTFRKGKRRQEKQLTTVFFRNGKVSKIT